jgi:integrase
MPRQLGAVSRVQKGGKTRWQARISYVDEQGKRRVLRRFCETKGEAAEALWQLRRQLEDEGGAGFDTARLTMTDLCDYYERTYMIPAKYVDGRKVAGLRGLRDLPARLKAIREYFGSKKLRSITHGDLERFKAARLAVPTRLGGQRSITTVNRDLALLRRLLSVAQREGWIVRNPFNTGDPLIQQTDERQRERILSREEEDRLLAACTGRRTHLRPIVICALDTGMRRGEIFALKWSDVDFERRLITIRAFNTKTMRERTIALTDRLERELKHLYEDGTPGPEGLVFGITDTVKTSFGSARTAAGLEDLRFHDLRHTYATRLVSAHIPLSEVGRVLGHTQANTTYRYVNADIETAKRAAAVLDALYADGEVDGSAAAVHEHR